MEGSAVKLDLLVLDGKSLLLILVNRWLNIFYLYTVAI